MSWKFVHLTKYWICSKNILLFLLNHRWFRWVTCVISWELMAWKELLMFWERVKSFQQALKFSAKHWSLQQNINICMLDANQTLNFAVTPKLSDVFTWKCSLMFSSQHFTPKQFYPFSPCTTQCAKYKNIFVELVLFQLFTLAVSFTYFIRQLKWKERLCQIIMKNWE